MDITIKITKAHIKHVQDMHDGITEAAAVEKIRRVVQNFVSTDDMLDDVFDGFCDD